MKTFIIVMETALIAFAAGVICCDNLLENDKEFRERRIKKWTENETPA